MESVGVAPFRVMLFAAGRGLRMMPLSADRPKPLLLAGGKSLIVWQIEALARAGFTDIVINTAWCGEQFEPALGDGERFGVRIQYSHEINALETVGGIVKASPMLGFQPKVLESAHGSASLSISSGTDAAPFVTVSGDVYSDYDYTKLRAPLQRIASGEIYAFFVLTKNPSYHLVGDFAIKDGLACMTGEKWNYGGIACWHPKLFANELAIKKKLFPWAYPLVEAGRVGAEFHGGEWDNVGTPSDLAALDQRLNAAAGASAAEVTAAEATAR